MRSGVIRDQSEAPGRDHEGIRRKGKNHGKKDNVRE